MKRIPKDDPRASKMSTDVEVDLVGVREDLRVAVAGAVAQVQH